MQLPDGQTYTPEELLATEGLVAGKFTPTEDDHSVIFEKEGDTWVPYDIAQNRETAVTMVNQGYIGIAVTSTDREDEQRILDHERELYLDCFGE